MDGARHWAHLPHRDAPAPCAAEHGPFLVAEKHGNAERRERRDIERAAFVEVRDVEADMVDDAYHSVP